MTTNLKESSICKNRISRLAYNSRQLILGYTSLVNTDELTIAADFHLVFIYNLF